MKSKLLVLGMALPLSAAGILGNSTVASAAFLNTTADTPPFNQLSLGVDFDIEDLNLVRVAPGTGSPNPVDLETVGFPGSGPLINFTTQQITVSGSTNLGGEAFTVCNDGNVPSDACSAEIFDFFADGVGIDDPYIQVTGAGAAAGLDYNFSLFQATLTDPSVPPTSVLKFTDDGLPDGPTAVSCAANPGQQGCAANIDFVANGLWTINGTAPGFEDQIGREIVVSYSYAGPRILVDGANSESCGFDVGDTCNINFLPTVGAQNILVSVPPANIPEPGSTGALVALGAVGSFGMLKRKRKIRQ